MRGVKAHRPETRWATRTIPFVLAGCIGFATYVIIQRICLDYFLFSWQQPTIAFTLLGFYCVFLVLMILTYFRVFFAIQLNPGVVPLGPKADEQTNTRRRDRRRRRRTGGRRRSHTGSEDDVEGDLEAAISYEVRPDDNPDSPGLEEFYSKDVFVCDTDGRPRWCSTCCNWKPDRAHHCSEIDRCVRKMDHYCPWVGGIVGETSFNYFVQFTFYTASCCLVLIVAAALCLQSLASRGSPVDGLVIAVLAISSFFGLFTFTMTATSIRYILLNLTNVDYLKSKSIVHQLAVRVPRGTPPGINYGIISYPLPKSTDEQSELTSLRDQLATRTFAIIKTEMGENPWELGPYRNWKSVMGNTIWDWVLPIRGSPCASFENNESFYEMGPLYPRLRERFGLPELNVVKEASERKEFEKRKERQASGTHTQDS